MGNSLRCCLACVLPCGALDLIRIVHLNGYVEEMTRPVTAGEILKANPNHILSKPCSQGMVRKILILSPDSELKRGSIYFLIPDSSLHDTMNGGGHSSSGKKQRNSKRDHQSEAVMGGGGEKMDRHHHDGDHVVVLTAEKKLKSKSRSRQNRSILAIDLNEIPSPYSEVHPASPSASSSAAIISPTSIVRSIHENPPPAEGPPADIPGEGVVSACGACGRPEVRGHVVVCDGCERGFHFGCAGMRGRQATLLDEWVCGDCATGGIGSRRWPLGRKQGVVGSTGGVRLFDMNASPPSDGDGGCGVADCSEEEGFVEVKDSRMRFIGDHACRGYLFGSPLPYSNFLYSGNGFGFQSASAIITHTVRLDFEDILPHRRSMSRSSTDVEFSSQLERLRSSSNATVKVPSWDPREIFLHALSEFIKERHGVLEEGWHVDFKPSKSSDEVTAVYCSPEGELFETVSDVAHHLGLMANGTIMEPEVRNDYGSKPLQKGLHIHKRRKLDRLSLADGFDENGCISMNGPGKDPCYYVQNEESHVNKFGNVLELTGAGSEANGGAGSMHYNDGLPVQYEDFFILSLGKVDTRKLYHDNSQIWPVGYRSCWHDKITGSLFLCDVVDDVDAGPRFKVRRFSCSALPIPYGATVLFKGSAGKQNGEKNESDNVVSCSSMAYDEDCNIEMFLLDPCLPADVEVLSLLGNSSNEVDLNFQIHSQLDVTSHSERLQHDKPVVGEKIGEFVVDGHSSSLVWSTLSEKLVDACQKIFKQTGSVKFFCKHVEDGFSTSYSDIANGKKNIYSSLDKFCSLLGSLNIPPVIRSDRELDSVSGSLKHWMSMDRFGLDVEFVQEIIEQLPGVHGCSVYEPLKKRNCKSTSPMVGNQLLLVNGKGGILRKVGGDGLDKGCKRLASELVENPVRCDLYPPTGKLLSSKLSPHLVGDVFQVWELLCRFYEVLGLEVPLPFDELESELISPWYENAYLLDKLEQESHGGAAKTSHHSKDLGGPSSSSGSDVDRLEESSHVFIEMETTAMRDEAHASLASSTCNRCTGFALRKAHISVLNLLIGELLMKMAALVDPSIDGGDSKPRRGRKRDVGSSYLARRAKLHMLPINELTWPELARRFLLAVICMDGNLDSADCGLHECSKVVRCLQGDGGVLCGSLSGVAGIEADALLLAEATRRICGTSNSQNDLFTIEEDEPVANGDHENIGVSDDSIPDWVQALEPVRKLPTNVGTRIRRCVYEALGKGPPEWARKILEHSISKEVYKGNASGPTKKAVLSVLQNVLGEGSNQKKIPKEQKRKTIISKSDIVMRQCRNVFRRAAGSDDDKLFCNLLSRNLMNLSENDDEGMLGSPAMVSRPLDFRTIDLRLAAGAYAGSYEAFLEDVRELWNNVRTAHADQPDMVQLAETLSQEFESLYRQEVVPLISKLTEYTESKCLSEEAKKEITDILASTNEMPKAPWDEGVCKVCGIDKDDDSVLLCDTCDAEYHTYCLSPPLARIPEGNWYCPSCATERASKVGQFLGIRNRKKYHGEAICAYLEELACLASAMEEKEYWELTVDERASLLKVLCNEMLNSTQIRQHIEQCAETSTDLQQKLRLLYSEGKTLKLREDIVVAKAAKLGLNIVSVDGGSVVEKHQVAAARNHNVSPPAEGGQQESTAPVELSGQTKASSLEKNEPGNNQRKDPADKMGQDVHDDVVGESKCCKSIGFDEMRMPNSHTSENGVDCESSSQVKMLESGDVQEVSLASDTNGSQIAGSVPSSYLIESQAYKHELNSVRKELSSLQQSTTDLESQLLKLSLRMEFLGSDSCGRLYWGSAKPGMHPTLVVDGTMAAHRKRRRINHRTMVRDVSLSWNFSSPGLKSDLNLEGSNAPCPFVYESDGSDAAFFQWFSYPSYAEVGELVRWLNDSDPQEKELKDSILHWQRVRCNGSSQSRDPSLDDLLVLSRSGEKADSPKLVTKALGVLEKNYGPCFSSGTQEKLKKRSKKEKVIVNEKFYRCACLEPIWPSRAHCAFCHRTFVNALECDGHADGRCASGGSALQKRKQAGESLGDTGFRKSESRHLELMREREKNEAASRSAGSRLIRFQNEGLMCPHKFEEISSKFVTNDSIKDLVQGIGLIGTDGIPSFVMSESPYLSDPALALPQDAISSVQPKSSEKAAPFQGHTEACVGSVSNAEGSATNKLNDNSEGSQADQSSTRSHQKTKKNVSSSLTTALEVSCIVPESSLRPLVGRAAQVFRQLKINLLDMEASLPEEARRPSKLNWDRISAWHAFVKSAETIFEMVQATIVLEDMIKTEYLRNEWWYWSSLSAAAKTSTLSALALRIYALDSVISYEKSVRSSEALDNSRASGDTEQQPKPNPDSSEKSKLGRRASKRRKETDS